MVLHVHKQRNDFLDLKKVANDFISSCEHRVYFIFCSFQDLWDNSRRVYKHLFIIVCIVRWVWSVGGVLALPVSERRLRA